MKVLCVGKACLDVVSYMDYYPAEDSDNTIQLQRWSQGGNASNNCVVLKQLTSTFCEESDQFQYELFSTFGTDLASNYVRHLLKDVNNAIVDKCPVISTGSGRLGTTCILINRSTASRTIVHAQNDIRDINYEDFVQARFKFDEYDWIHFETRSAPETRKMLDFVLDWRNKSNSKKPLISVELEKEKERASSLFRSGIDYFFVGKEFAIDRNCETMRETARYVKKFFQDDHATTVVCPWGEEGACVLESESSNEPFVCPAFQTERAIDTLGAGDTFFSSFIFAKCYLKKSSKEALKFATLAAGVKCGTVGYDEIGDRLKEIIRKEGVDYLTSW